MTQIPNPISNRNSAGRWLPLIILAGLAVGAYLLGLQKYLSLEVIAVNRDFLVNYVSNHLVLALLIYVAVYISATALSLPGAGILSIVGGFVFGWALSAPVTIVAATIGATIMFQIVKTSLGASMAEKAGPFVQRLSADFANDAFNYLLFLRLVPAFPFFVVNAVAGVCRVPLKTFVIATFLGIIPGSFAFAWLGRGLGSIIDAQSSAHARCVVEKGIANCPFELSYSSLVTPQLLLAFAALAVVSLIPVALKKWKAVS